MAEPVTSDIPEIEAVLTEERLLERALLDFVQEFARHIICGKTVSEAVAALDCWRNWLETFRRHSQ